MYGPIGGNGIMGRVTSISSSSISVEDARSGSASTFSITASTKVVNNGKSASASDIKVGDSVVVIPSSSESTLADQIVINSRRGPNNTPNSSSSPS